MVSSNYIPQIVQALSDERNLAPEVIFEALEAALALAARRKLGQESDARVSIDQETGDYETYRRWEVIEDEEEIEFPERQISLAEAREKNSGIQAGEFVEIIIPSRATDRISAAATRQVVMQKVREAERDRVYREFAPRKGTMLSGVVRRVDRGDVIVETEGVEALLPRMSCISKDGFRQGDRVRAILKDVRSDPRGPQLILDRTSPELLIELFKLEVPETREGLIEIRSAARDPGLRAKIAVRAVTAQFDPIGACVGVRGTRVQSVSKEIAGERVDIVEWSSNAAQFVINALAPAVVEKVVANQPDVKAVDVVVSESQLSKAIGRAGQNVRLASQLTGWEINIMTRDEQEQKLNEEAQKIAAEFMDLLDVDEDVATVLIQNEYTTLLDIVCVEPDVLEQIEQFDADLVSNIQSRAADAMLQREFQAIKQSEENVPDDTLYEVEAMDETTAQVLAANGIRTMEELQEADTFTLVEIPGISEDRAKELIMSARAPWFEQLEQ